MNVSRNLEINCVAKRECPPNSKKLESLLTLSSFRISHQIFATISSVAVLGGLYNFNFDDLQSVTPDIYFIPWKTFNHTFAWKVRLKKDKISYPNWNYYENNRTWWRGINELQKFL